MRMWLLRLARGPLGIRHRGVELVGFRRSHDLAKIRNVGILAHIDAGKTTTTERMLYYAGFMSRVGEVHRGDTVMDFMEQERDRGITISAAAITFLWQRNQINLIDTPGHVDFTVEVERALRVLDGAVVVLDASAGVQAQTMTVWRQANRHQVPRIAFLNKLDKANASVDHSLATMRSKLGVDPLLLQIPLGHGSSFRGVIDLVDLRLLTWSRDSDKSWGKQYTATPLQSGHEHFDMALEERTRLIDRISDLDDAVAKSVLETESYENVSAKLLKDALRRITLSNSPALVTLCGSAFKNISVQPLMDAVVDFLPSPSDVTQRFLDYFPEHAFCGLAFKILHHPQKGVLTFIRIYSGTLKEGDNLFNMNRGAIEKPARLMIAFADDFKVVKEVSSGSIAVVSGLKETITGDTLVHKASIAREAAKKWSEQGDGSDDDDEGHLPGVPVPDPVFYCSVEPPSAMYQKQLDLALTNLAREDPSLRVRTDLETGQTVLSGMGELHLEIVKDRILKEYKIEADLGPLSIAYREAPTKAAVSTTSFKRRILDKSYELSVEMSIEPTTGGGKATLSLTNDRRKREELDANLKPWQLKEVYNGFNDSIGMGPLLGYSIVNAAFKLCSILVSPGTPDTLIKAAISEAVKSAMQESDCRLMEPIMRLEILSEGEVSSIVNQDVMRRGGTIETIDDAGELKLLVAVAPLAQLRGYSTQLRTLTSGKAYLGMEFSHYELMDAHRQDKAIEEVTGFAPKAQFS